jgi:hypothetical protein
MFKQMLSLGDAELRVAVLAIHEGAFSAPDSLNDLTPELHFVE